MKGRAILANVICFFVSFLIAIAISLTLFENARYFLISAVVFTVALAILLPRIFKRKKDDISICEAERGAKSKRFVFCLCFATIAMGSLVYWLAYYPGGFNLDAYGQWDQAHGLMQLDNWHPIITTLFYRLLISICDSFPFVIVVQLLLFAIAFSVLMTAVYDATGYSVWVIEGIALITAFNPAVQMNNVCLVKDVPFCVAILFNITVSIWIYRSDGEWFSKRRNRVIYFSILAIIVLIRYNGFFFILPELVVMAAVYRTQIKRIAFGGIAVLLAVVFVNGPLLKLLDVRPHSNTVGEIVGVPMAAMANALLNENGEHLPPDVEAFLLDIAPLEDWQQRYYLGEWDSCKWEFGGTELLKNESLGKVLRYAYKTALKCPQSTYESIRENTRIVWQFVGANEWEPWIYIEENNMGIQESHVHPFSEFVGQIFILSKKQPICSLIWNIGIYLILALLATANTIFKKNYAPLLFLLPPIAYDLGTMLLLSGPNYRYFYFNAVIVLPIVLILLWQPSNNSLTQRRIVNEGNEV